MHLGPISELVTKVDDKTSWTSPNDPAAILRICEIAGLSPLVHKKSTGDTWPVENASVVILIASQRRCNGYGQGDLGCFAMRTRSERSSSGREAVEPHLFETPNLISPTPASSAPNFEYHNLGLVLASPGCQLASSHYFHSYLNLEYALPF